MRGRLEKSTTATTVIVVVDAHPPASMPGLGATDPANLKAQAHAELGFSRRLKQPRCISPYPGLWGGGGYNVWYHKQQLQRFDAGEAINVSRRSINRWADRLEPFRQQTGNRERTTIIGVDLLNLVTYITAWPDATLDEMAVFIYNEGGGSLLPPGNIQSPLGA